MLPFRRLLIDKAALADELTREVQQRLRHLPVEVIEDKHALVSRRHGTVQDIARGKETLLLARQQGPFWRSCPGTPEYICCGYQVLQVMTNCPFDCSYCVLQGYLNLPAITVFTNLPDLFAELESRLAADPKRVWRLGTGEFGDSLALDDLLGLNRRLIPFFARQPRALLEIKTKWHKVERLLPLGPAPQVVFAWSLNSPRVIRAEEHGSAPLAARLAAARRCAGAGFRLAFHFDPIIYYPGWEEDYRQVVDRLFGETPADAIAWISLGCLRFMPTLKDVMRQRFPASRAVEAEFITGLDGKKRYFKSLRIEIFSRFREWIATHAPETVVYLCMESPAVWQGVFGRPMTSETLAAQLDGQVRGSSGT